MSCPNIVESCIVDCIANEFNTMLIDHLEINHFDFLLAYSQVNHKSPVSVAVGHRPAQQAYHHNVVINLSKYCENSSTHLLRGLLWLSPGKGRWGRDTPSPAEQSELAAGRTTDPRRPGGGRPHGCTLCRPAG
eukprot:scaffold317330_cov32-Prasinocladus_malaysianus.AAC.1